MSKVMPITGALVALLAAAPGAVAQVTSGQDTTNSPWGTVRRDPGTDTTTATGRTTTTTTTTVAAAADTAYIRQAIRGNVNEVTLGRLADSRADNDTVEDFAERMVSDHNSTNGAWAQLARNSGMRIDTEVSPAVQQTIERLEDLDGAQFDQTYMAEVIRQHEQALAAFQRMGTGARSSEVRELADREVLNIREHLALARQVGSSVGVSTTAGRTGGVTGDRQRTTADRATGNQRADRNDRDGVRADDRAFIQNVLQDHLMHIRLAERAQREAKNNDTRRLAERIEDDFKKWQDRWEDLAKRHDVKAPKNLGRLHGQKVDRLERASKQNVDRVYAQIVAEHLASVVPYFEKEGQAVRPSAARRLVDDELPMIREHLQRARRLQGDKSARAEDRN